MINYKQYNLLLEHNRIVDISILYNYYEIYNAFLLSLVSKAINQGDKQINSLESRVIFFLQDFIMFW